MRSSVSPSGRRVGRRALVAGTAAALAVLLWAATLVPARADDTPAAPPPAAADDPADAALSSARTGSLRDFALPDLDGKVRTLADFRGVRVLVLAWTAPGCPVSQVYAPRLARAAKEYEARGVRFLGVESDAGVDPAEVRSLVERTGTPFPVVLDAKGVLAERVGATTSTAVAVLDANRMIRYVGAVDDQYGVTGRKEAPTKSWMVDAIEAVLGNRAVETPRTEAPGCALTIDAPAKGATEATWHADVAPLVEARCAACHRPGQIAPFSLVTYRDVKSRRAVIREVVSEGRMPPWHADAPRGTFENDLRLEDAEKSMLLEWIDAGAPEGKADAARPRRAAASDDGWVLGPPDAVLSFAEAQPIPAEGTVRYRYVEVPTDFPEDRWVRASEVRPGEPTVVHHVLVALTEPGKKNRMAFEPTRGFFSAMVPGRRPVVYPDGMAKKLPKGSSLLFQMHYTPNGVATTDLTRIALYFAKEPPAKEVHTVGVYNPRLRIPAGAKDFEVTAAVPVLFDARILSYMPHMHVRGSAFRYELTKPGEKDARVILSVPRYDFNWQAPYRLKEPLVVPRGMWLRAVGTYDNSPENPYNPDPTKDVRWGDQTWDEMMIGYVDYVIDS
jgi:peroxiredoxin